MLTVCHSMCPPPHLVPSILLPSPLSLGCGCRLFSLHRTVLSAVRVRAGCVKSPARSCPPLSWQQSGGGWRVMMGHVVLEGVLYNGGHGAWNLILRISCSQKERLVFSHAIYWWLGFFVKGEAECTDLPFGLASTHQRDRYRGDIIVQEPKCTALLLYSEHPESQKTEPQRVAVSWYQSYGDPLPCVPTSVRTCS